MPKLTHRFRVLEGAVLAGTCALAFSLPRLADACGATPPGLTASLPIDGASHPGNAALLFWGSELSLEAVTVTVDGEPATLVPAPFADGLAALAVAVEPAPQAGQTVVLAGKFCQEPTDCDAALTYTVSAPDLAAPAPIVDASFFAVYDHVPFQLQGGCEQTTVERTLYVHLQQPAPAAGEAPVFFRVEWEGEEDPGAGLIRRTEQAIEETTIIPIGLDANTLGMADVLSEVCLEVVARDAAGNASEPFELCPPCFLHEDEAPIDASASLPPEPAWAEAEAVPGSACARATETTGEETTDGESGESGEAPTTGNEPTTGDEPPGSETDGPDEGTDSATAGDDEPGKGCACRSDREGGSLGHLLLLVLGLGAARRRR